MLLGRIMIMETLSWILQSCSSSFSTMGPPFRWTLTLKRRTTVYSGENTHSHTHSTINHYNTGQKFGFSNVVWW